MFKIIEKKLLAPEIYLMEIEAPRVANSANPGQFVIVKAGEKGERIPLTICDYDIVKGTVTIVIQAIGASTKKIVSLNKDEYIDDFAGPLGNASEFIHENIEELKKKKVCFIAGGVGIAPIYPQVKWFSQHNIPCDVIIGAKSKDFLFYINELKALDINLHICTDDGTEGNKGLVTETLKKLVDSGSKFDEVIAIGPMIMMKFVALLTKQLNIKTIVSLNTLMIDGTGMCGGCRVTVGSKQKFTCVDGPEFDGHLVDFEEAMRRQTMYKNVEKNKDHNCNINLGY